MSAFLAPHPPSPLVTKPTNGLGVKQRMHGRDCPGCLYRDRVQSQQGLHLLRPVLMDDHRDRTRLGDNLRFYPGLEGVPGEVLPEVVESPGARGAGAGRLQQVSWCLRQVSSGGAGET